MLGKSLKKTMRDSNQIKVAKTELSERMAEQERSGLRLQEASVEFKYRRLDVRLNLEVSAKAQEIKVAVGLKPIIMIGRTLDFHKVSDFRDYFIDELDSEVRRMHRHFLAGVAISVISQSILLVFMVWWATSWF